MGGVGGFALFLATVLLLLTGGEVSGPSLSLFANYLIGYRVTWVGAFVGLVEAAALGFIIGFLFAHLRNLGLAAYAYYLKRRMEGEISQDIF